MGWGGRGEEEGVGLRLVRRLRGEARADLNINICHCDVESSFVSCFLKYLEVCH